ncbi:ThuA domain-containing protein [Phytomonospora sp. NPDC050363]|uniref:ThuA domain-containing protein n=1 Tax=Phytomonospora sp. NPDC050363 TaxID=3155642 RepID=UPI0033FC1042
MARRAAATLTAAFLTALAVAGPAGPAAAEDAPAFSVLVLTPPGSDGGGEEAAVAKAEQSLAIMGRSFGVRVDVTHDPAAISADGLSSYQAVLWAGVSGSVLDEAGRAALTSYVEGGGGFVAASAATVNAEPEWDWYAQTVGPRVVADTGEAVKKDVTLVAEHPSSKDSSTGWDSNDVWYAPVVDPAEIPGTTTIASYPGDDSIEVQTTWVREVGAGRVMVTSMGNDYDAWGEGDFVKMIRGGLWWASGTDAPILVRADMAAPSWPYIVSFVLWVGAIIVGGVIAVTRTTGRGSGASVPLSSKG